MPLQIIIKGDEENKRRLKGKSITELAKNLESEGWPSEFVDEEQRDRVAFTERKLGRPLTRSDVGQPRVRVRE